MRTNRLQRVRFPRRSFYRQTSAASLAFLRNLGLLGHIREVMLVVGAYFSYMYTRKLAFPDVEVQAFANAFRLLDFQKAGGFLWEHTVQETILNNANPIIYVLNWMYVITFLPIVGVTAIFFYVRDIQTYRVYRNIVLLSFVVAMLVFMVFPLAPPRMLPWEGFVDTVKTYGPAFYSNREAQSYFNAFAAMPSLHFAWTILFGILFYRTGIWWLKVLAPVYPAVTLLAIVGTGNHYLLDAVGGGFVAITSLLIYRYVISRKSIGAPLLAKKRQLKQVTTEEGSS